MKQRLQSLLFAVGMILLPVIAFADDDEKPQPMTDHDKMIQGWAWVMIAVLILVPLAWYQYRKWSILKSGNQSHGTGYHQD